MRVKPAPGLKVRDPDHALRHIPAEGAEVPETTYWIRRLADGDVVRMSDSLPVDPIPETGDKESEPVFTDASASSEE